MWQNDGEKYNKKGIGLALSVPTKQKAYTYLAFIIIAIPLTFWFLTHIFIEQAARVHSPLEVTGREGIDAVVIVGISETL